MLKALEISHKEALTEFYRQFPTIEAYPDLSGKDRLKIEKFYYYSKQVVLVNNKMNQYRISNE